ncbi:hypothetical protein KTO58_13030 [Chitinophaga pendula]|uniref:hypothetical protein n=1 Tax=Chitinophaga TaxID=79328 RepID=UPI000BAEE0EA|nr:MULTISPECIES: hypothetical protein [Chitinophaga]ASZ12328.1 hypothetical protein CK934_15855 [Chitinophaga sp. MD30]UCJ10078.1 hypothetical protein KTO58_13030 [Chitinophaga pendula]
MKKFYWLLSLWILAICPAMTINATPLKDTLLLRNAYEVARAFNKLKRAPETISLTQQSQLLGSLIWYANLQDRESDELVELLGRTLRTRYPSLYDGLKRLIRSSVKSYDTLFTQEYLTRHELDFRRPAEKALLDTLKSYQLQLQDLKNKQATQQALLRSVDSLTRVIAPIKDTVNKLALEDTTYIKYQLDATWLSSKSKELQALDLEIDQRETRLTNTKIKTIKYIDVNIMDLQGALKSIIEAPDYRIPKEIFDEAKKELYSQAAVQARLNQDNLLQTNTWKLPTQSEMIDALAIYIAKRVKQESVMWFFETITKNANRYELVSTFFPATIRLLQANEIYEIPNMGAQWQYALSKDFAQMPRNVLSSNWLTQRLPWMDTAYRPYLIAACDMADMLMKRYSYRDMIKTIYLSNAAVRSNDRGFGDFINLLYGVNNELFLPDTAGGYRLLKYEDYRLLSRDELEMMLSLLDLKYNHSISRIVRIGNSPVFPFEGSGISAEQVRQFLGKVEAAIGQVDKIREEFVRKQDQLEAAGQKDWAYNAYNVWSAVYQLTSILDIQPGTPDIFTSRVAEMSRALHYTGEVYEIYNLISKKNFAGAVYQTISLIDTLLYTSKSKSQLKLSLAQLSALDKDPSTLFSHIKGSLEKEIAANKKDYTMAAKYNFKVQGADTILFAKTSKLAAVVFEKDRHALQLIRKLSGFLNDAALAQNDKQLARVVESYALPPGSYKRKRNTWWSVDLNAFVGPYIGHEIVDPSIRNKQSGKEPGAVYGLSVPIGISVSKTFGKKIPAADTLTYDQIMNPDKIKLKRDNIRKRKDLTMTFTLSIIDPAAVVSYRLQNGADTVLPQQVNWEQIISPGAHLAVAIPGTPLVASTGIQYTPKLRNFSKDQPQYNAFRLYFGIFFDLPLFNIWERRRIVK